MISTCYHLRDNRGNKLLGGTINKQTLDEAAMQITKELDGAVLNSGRIVFMRNGQEVNAYLSIDPAETPKGRDAYVKHLKEREAAEAARRLKEKEVEDMLESAINKHGQEKVLEILKGLS